MSIQDLSSKFKGFLKDTDLLLALLIIAVSLVSFFLGRLSVPPPLPLNDTVRGGEAATALNALSGETAAAESINTANAAASTTGGYVASKSGTKYHLPWCGSAKQIKEENKIWFATKEEAEAAGYTPAANCKGI